MPVPVSVHVKCPDKSVSALRHLVSSLPDPPPGPPPAFTDRDTWIRSLPPARRFKLRLDQSDDLVISHDLPSTKSAYAPLSNGKPWPPPPPSPAKHVTTLAERRKTTIRMPTSHLLNEDWTEDEAFFPRPPCIAVDTNHKRHSNPFPSSSSSPLWNLNSSSASRARHSLPPPPPSAPISHNHSVVQSQVAPAAPSPLNIVNSRNPPSSPVSATVTPIDMALYKHRVADPMSAWVAKYVWKVVTQGLSLPPEFVANDSGYGASTRAYAAEPPIYLAESIRTLLCATLLQPSAIFLALWYLARFPVYFGVFDFDPVHQSKYHKFRLELIGEGSAEPGAEKNRQLLEAHAPFRLFLLGLMLANKWLDDNTFSNKTWHQVSGIPIHALNKLEILGLDLLSHDLSLPLQAWLQWLEHIQSYHRSLAPYPEPIGPPKETPHTMIRHSIDELMAAGSPTHATSPVPAPVFLGLAERNKEGSVDAFVVQGQFDLYEVDLDKDGPLREEYFPKKKTNKEKNEKGRWLQDLPPPAGWSPAADPPIHRSRPVYQAVQGPVPPPAPVLSYAYPATLPTMTMISASNNVQVSGFFPDPHKQEHFNRTHQMPASTALPRPFLGTINHMPPTAVPSAPFVAPVDDSQYREDYIPNTAIHCHPECVSQHIPVSALFSEDSHRSWMAVAPTHMPMPVPPRHPGSCDPYRSTIMSDVFSHPPPHPHFHHHLHYLFRPTWLRT